MKIQGKPENIKNHRTAFHVAGKLTAAVIDFVAGAVIMLTDEIKIPFGVRIRSLVGFLRINEIKEERMVRKRTLKVQLTLVTDPLGIRHGIVLRTGNGKRTDTHE